ncbi:hypothetical protein GH15_132 [Staphylococcus phage G15]|uniref:Uncharacterized protein n=1 Tax=Staphylococcus phage G15 TaxID=760530 RepID=I6P9S5_BPG15|nr:hypothetical protein F360_gp132 [Staphylococcus phage G15]AFF28604.1 hypothetical protein GH15_132 [Staphylococcus phage G15]
MLLSLITCSHHVCGSLLFKRTLSIVHSSLCLHSTTKGKLAS